MATTKKTPYPDLSFENEHRAQKRIALGVDEVGRGCLAGPVVTAAVVLPDFIYEADSLKDADKERQGKFDPQGRWWLWLTDSKLVRPALREQLSALILQHALVQVAWCLPEEIDSWNILRAAMIAMRRAMRPFHGKAQAVLVDGNASPFHPRYGCDEDRNFDWGFSHVETIVKGDQRSLSIAAASVVAKVYRDRWMSDLDSVFPGYGFSRHKGYSTPVHYAALDRLGPCAIHRYSFAPIRDLVHMKRSMPNPMVRLPHQ